LKDFGKRIWGGTIAFLDLTRKADWIGLLILGGLVGILAGMVSLAKEWTGQMRPTVAIDLSPWALPKYTFFSLSRGLIAYVFSLAFTLVYGYWAAKDRIAQRLLIPLLDILQSIPVLGFMPGLILGLVALFPSSNIGLELAAVVMIFTGQAWNMTFSFYHSLRSVPQDQREVSTVYHFNWWETFKWVELPFSMIGLVWNSMMSMAGGWFFLMINEAFVLGNKDFRLPGIGSYMSVAVAKGDTRAMIWAIISMTLMIVVLDQLLWRPVVVWAQKFRVEEGGRQEVNSSWLLDWLRRSSHVKTIKSWAQQMRDKSPKRVVLERKIPAPTLASRILSMLFFCILLASLCAGGWYLVKLLRGLSLRNWGEIVFASFTTLGRVLLSTIVGTIWTVPVGLAIGLSGRLSRIFQPIVQIFASFPAPMLFPIVIAGLSLAGVPLGWGSILLMLLGTQWYILFNVIAGAMFIPSDLKEAARSYRISGVQRFIRIYLPAIFPYLVTGWVTAAGGAWNASIVAEYVSFKGNVITAWGIGSRISEAAQHANFPLLAASIVVMSTVVVLFNRTVWRWCYNLAEKRFSLSN
jgi:NitT/TauT family transport system permease protein